MVLAMSNGVGWTAADSDEVVSHVRGIVDVVGRVFHRKLPGRAVLATIINDDFLPDMIDMIGDRVMFTLPDDSPARHVRVMFVDSRGNETTVDGAPEWAASGDLLTVVADADGYGATITPIGPTGTGQLSVTADAAPGAEVATLVGLEDFEIVPGRAVTATISLEPAAEAPAQTSRRS